jgi:polar amino acid transport system substrate-binding protein
VTEICARNHIAVEQQTPPVARSLLQVNQGIADGDGPRIGGLSSAYPNIICVPEPFGDFEFSAFSKNKNIRLDGWSGLSSLNVAYIQGWKIFDNKLTTAKSITKVKDKELLFKLLDADRVDVVLITKLTGFEMLRNLDMKTAVALEPSLAVEPNYLYLHKRHAEVIPRLTQTLRKMKADGLYDHIYQEMISPYLPK